MNAFVLWLLIGFVASTLEMWFAIRRAPETFRQLGSVRLLVLLSLLMLGGPLTLATSIAAAFPRRT